MEVREQFLHLLKDEVLSQCAEHLEIRVWRSFARSRATAAACPALFHTESYFFTVKLSQGSHIKIWIYAFQQTLNQLSARTIRCRGVKLLLGPTSTEQVILGLRWRWHSRLRDLTEFLKLCPQ